MHVGSIGVSDRYYYRTHAPEPSQVGFETRRRRYVWGDQVPSLSPVRYPSPNSEADRTLRHGWPRSDRVR